MRGDVIYSLSSVHARGNASGAWSEVPKGFVPWLLTMLLVSIAVSIASLALVVPGIVVGLRLFWADELALMEREGRCARWSGAGSSPRNATGRILGLQLRIALLGAVLWLPFALILMLAGPAPGPGFEWSAGRTLGILLTSFAGWLAYSLFHAVETPVFGAAGRDAARQCRDGRLRLRSVNTQHYFRPVGAASELKLR